MPANVFRDKAFFIGFLGVVIGAIFGVVYSIIAAIFNLIPILGVIVIIVLGFALVVAVEICMLRMALFDRFSAAFDFPKIWQTCKRSPGSLLFTILIPTLIIGAVAAILSTIFVGISIGIGIPLFPSMMMGYGYGVPVPGAAGLILVLILLYLLVMVVILFASTLVSVLVTRALGHWILRYAPEWVSEAMAQTNTSQNR